MEPEGSLPCSYEPATGQLCNNNNDNNNNNNNNNKNNNNYFANRIVFSVDRTIVSSCSYDILGPVSLSSLEAHKHIFRKYISEGMGHRYESHFYFIFILLSHLVLHAETRDCNIGGRVHYRGVRAKGERVHVLHSMQGHYAYLGYVEGYWKRPWYIHDIKSYHVRPCTGRR
jgi:hypothetical protein